MDAAGFRGDAWGEPEILNEASLRTEPIRHRNYFIGSSYRRYADVVRARVFTTVPETIKQREFLCCAQSSNSYSRLLLLSLVIVLTYRPSYSVLL